MQWQTRRVVAYTEADGPGRPPRGPARMLAVGLSYALAAVFVGMASVDTLCPDHRAWVQGLGAFAFVAVIVSVVGLARGWAFASFLTVVAASAGVAIGAIDAVHDRTRGVAIALAFGAVAIVAAVLAVRTVALNRWDRQLAAELDDADPAMMANADVESSARDASPITGAPNRDADPVSVGD